VIGAQGSPYLQPNQWQASVGYRWQRSDRHFTGDTEDEERAEEGSQVINDLHLMDLAATYAASERFNATLSLPIVVASRSQRIRDLEGELTPRRNHTDAHGIGDMSLLGRYWVLDPAVHTKSNFSLGLGVKFPTGQNDVEDEFIQPDGSVERRTVDQSIQPGDGGFGVVFDVGLFHTVFEDSALFFQATYLSNPRNTNGVRTFRRLEDEQVMSVADSFIARIGGATPLSKNGLSFTLAGRLEGVPVNDLLGDSDGFRRPGVAVSIEPGFVFAAEKNIFSIGFPVAIYRNRFRSVADRREGPEQHGDAAFADFLILFGYSRRFDVADFGTWFQ
jgi:hypothetical protein